MFERATVSMGMLLTTTMACGGSGSQTTAPAAPSSPAPVNTRKESAKEPADQASASAQEPESTPQKLPSPSTEGAESRWAIGIPDCDVFVKRVMECEGVPEEIRVRLGDSIEVWREAATSEEAAEEAARSCRKATQQAAEGLDSLGC